MTKKKGKRVPRSRRVGPAQGQAGGPQLTTPEGDPLVFAQAFYRHDALDEIRRLLQEADDFNGDEGLEAGPDGTFQVSWLEAEAAAQPMPLGRRVLATVTVTPRRLALETVSRQRRRACCRRLEEMLGEHIQLEGMETKSMAEALRQPGPPPGPEPPEVPPEVIAELEDRMIRQWLEESIPALDGLTPREAARTAKGRKLLAELFDYIERQAKQYPTLPGMFSPDYSKAKKMLGLE
jgi:hypothetical protein